MENVIEIKGVTKSYKGFKLGEIDVEIPMKFDKAAGFRRTGRRERAYPDAQTRQLAFLIA